MNIAQIEADTYHWQETCRLVTDHLPDLTHHHQAADSPQLLLSHGQSLQAGETKVVIFVAVVDTDSVARGQFAVWTLPASISSGVRASSIRNDAWRRPSGTHAGAKHLQNCSDLSRTGKGALG